MVTRIEDAEFVIFDVETTGLDPKSGDRIVEIAAIRVKNGREADSFSSLVNPQRSVSAAAFAVNNISEDMLIGAPDSSMVLPQFLRFSQGGCLAAYNTSFDLGFITNELQPLGLSIDAAAPVIDVLLMAKRLLPALGRYALWYVAQTFSIRGEQSHRALSDVRLTLEVFNKLMAIARERGIDDFINFFNLFGLNVSLAHSAHQQKIIAIQKAIDLNMRIKISYFTSTKASVSDREVTPKALKAEAGKDFLVGFCHLRNEERNFRIDRILRTEVISA